MHQIRACIVILLFLGIPSVNFSQIYDLGYSMVIGEQLGKVLQRGGTTGNPVMGKSETYIMHGGRLNLFKSFLNGKQGNAALGIEAGLCYAYILNRRKTTHEPEYLQMLDQQNFISRSFGSLQVPLQLAFRRGWFCNKLDTEKRSLGLSAGGQLITFYLPDERGTMIVPCISGSVGVLKYLVFRFEMLIGTYKSEYPTTQQPIERLTNSFTSMSLTYTLK